MLHVVTETFSPGPRCCPFTELRERGPGALHLLVQAAAVTAADQGGRTRHAAVVSTVNQRIHRQEFGRLFAVVHFAGRQWKVTDEDLILIENHIEAECGERIRIEKVLLVGAEDFTLIGRPLLGKELVRVEATVIEKTESWPKVHMRFWKRHRFQRKRIIIQPQTVLRINSIELAPRLT
uniref:large ribosomal subunit protein bL21m n=1 Tax=Monopterus albus TaxID=43700 RepID=UPI0009B41956|nr:39S ribosomal protein L21, mitochondrial [Monopterus albus]